MQHLDPNRQISNKQATLLEQLQHIAGIQPASILAPLTSPTTGYRHKARLGVKYVVKKDKVLVGFHEINGRYLADINSCSVLHPAVGQKILDIAEVIASLSAYQTIPQIEVAIGDEQIALVIRHLQALGESDLNKLQAFASLHQFAIYLQPGGMDSIHKFYPENSSPYLHYAIPEEQLIMNFCPSDFTQVNPFINRQMIQRAIEWLQPGPEDKVLDLFCGIGNFTLPLARHCQHVVGVEGSATAIVRAKENQQHNALSNAEFHVYDLSKDCQQQPWMQIKYNKILLDPPRTGALELMEQITHIGARDILYVSCNPATMARDAKILVEKGYKLTKACVMDMFPHTSHVESMALFSRL